MLHKSLALLRGGLVGRKFLRFRPSSMKAGDSLVSLSGVFLYVNSGLVTAKLSSFPSDDTFSHSNLLASLMAISALVLAWGRATDVSLWCTPYCLRNVLNLSEVY